MGSGLGLQDRLSWDHKMTGTTRSIVVGWPRTKPYSTVRALGLFLLQHRVEERLSLEHVASDFMLEVGREWLWNQAPSPG